MEQVPDCIRIENQLAAPLACFSSADIEQVGGKAANLGELIRAGFPVPPGFVVTTAAYDHFVDENALGIRLPLGQGEPLGAAQGAPGKAQSGASIRHAFENAAIPVDVVREIRAAVLQLGPGPTAVRSSATAEDLPEAAFAGQQDTFLNVIGEEALLDAVRRCWASLWTDRAISYRERQGISGQAVKLAVVIQCMVAADSAGVMFTANPVTGARDEIVIDASPGLGEAVVSGLVTPDHFVLRRGRLGWSVNARQAGRREVVIRPRPEGGTEQVEGAGASAPGLPDGALRKLARLGEAIQGHFGRPQDIEWAWAGGELFILQARPITALPEPLPHPTRPLQMLSAMFAEMFPLRPYPLDETTWVTAISDAAVTPVFSLLGIEVPPLSQFFTKKEGVLVTFKGSLALRPTPAVLLAPLRLLYLSLRYHPLLWRADPHLSVARLRAQSLETLDLEKLTWKDLLDTVREALALAMPLAGKIRRRYFPGAILSAGLLRVFLGLLGQGKYFGTLLSGTQSETSAANLALERLAARVRLEPRLVEIFTRHASGELGQPLKRDPAGQAFLADLGAFLDRFGHREVVLSSVLQPTWKDDPELVLGLLKGLVLTAPAPKNKPPAWEVARDTVLAHPLLRASFLRAAFLSLLSTARCFFQIREDTHFEATRILPILRRTFLELGRRLVQRGVLDRPEDIFHLELSELEQVGDSLSPERIHTLQATVRQRKELRASLEGTPLIDPRLYQQEQAGGDTLLKGTPGSPGIAEGPVRVIRTAAEFGKLRTGEVLVAPYTNPAWTPLFQRAAAVVVDGGAAGSHAAIVAREYGVPAVMGTVIGTQKLQDGDWVRVDGYRGTVQPTQPRPVEH